MLGVKRNTVAFKKNASALRKLSKLSHQKRKLHLKNWDIDAFKDIKNISKAICNCKKIPLKTLVKLKPHKKIIKKIASSHPIAVRKILINQEGGFLGALAGGLIPLIIEGVQQLVKAVS